MEAQCSAGTFYTYFASKEEIFAAVMELAREDMMHPGMPHTPKGADPAEVIAASNRAYLEAYRRNAKLMGLLEQVASIDPEFRVLRLERADAFVRRNARSIEKLQKAGVTINRPPRDGRMAFVRSPDNISIELLQKGVALPPAEPPFHATLPGSALNAFMRSAMDLCGELAGTTNTLGACTAMLM